MTLPILTLAIGAFLIWAAITGQNPLSVVKDILSGGRTSGATRNPKPLN